MVKYCEWAKIGVFVGLFWGMILVTLAATLGLILAGFFGAAIAGAIVGAISFIIFFISAICFAMAYPLGRFLYEKIGIKTKGNFKKIFFVHVLGFGVFVVLSMLAAGGSGGIASVETAIGLAVAGAINGLVIPFVYNIFNKRLPN